ncbi:heparinase II/III domain-containing protein [Synoicihabitans lomoniglobus]|uniref:Heparinase II/III family protein n=1 Tax=Synoicihabitans lomoniglobus TaxID=2909285 RepID=A0AAE9ZWD7_9BACT|nr:heparinase II/III-family protein [Opitutaceae bacterium LMO-M01]WED65367.1 heparinase II/III family protein [Opitutaceae bacterium LMO-M01]
MSELPPLARRRFLQQASTATAAWWISPRLFGSETPTTHVHPRIYLSASGHAGLRTPADLRAAIASDAWSRATWDRIVQLAQTEATQPPLLPHSPVPRRAAASIRDRNLDYHLCEATGTRLVRFALVHLITGDAACRAAALAQIEALYDPERWPDWIDQSHVRFGHPADLRTGMLAQDVAIAYDWLAPSLDATERAFIIEGLNRRGIQPFLTSVTQDAWWTHDLNNWLTVIYGGLGITGMVLAGEHPDADRLVSLALDAFERYLSIYGERGEFNESVAYANANRMPVALFLAQHYATAGGDNRLARPPFPELCRWVMHGTLTNRRLVPFGDCHPEAPVMAGYISAVAAAAQDGVLQHYYLTQQAETTNPLELVWYDPRVRPDSPAGREPLATAFTAHGGMIVSRTSWDPDRAACIVFAKSGREENHEHNDVGQLGFDALGERLIIDIGSPSSYPADFFEPHSRWQYYNASIRSHNVLMFGGREQRYPVRERGESIDVSDLAGKVTAWSHEPGHGTAWRIDLTPAYTGAIQVTRTVLHLWPGYVLVFDEAELDAAEEISLRWHTIDQAEPTAAGAFVVHGNHAACVGHIAALDDTDLTFRRREHAYAPPYHLERSGDPLEQRHESYIEATATGSRCRWLTLFASGTVTDFGANQHWQRTSNGWTFSGPEGLIEAKITTTEISLRAREAHRSISLA